MKIKRIWMVIGCILALGVLLTAYTGSIVKDQPETEMAREMDTQGEMLPQETPLSVPGNENLSVEPGTGVSEARGREARSIDGAQAPAVAAEGRIAEAKTGSKQEADETGTAVAFSESGTADDMQETDGPSAAARENRVYSPEEESISAPISPLAGAPAETEAKEEADCIKRLENLDAQIQKMREEEVDGDVYSAKTSAQTELKLWESELNAVYSDLQKVLGKEEGETLARQQQEWTKNREIQAAEDSGKNGQSVDSMEYAAKLVSLTRDRAYELARRYEKIEESASDTESTAS